MWPKGSWFVYGDSFANMDLRFYPQDSLNSERERADEYERKYNESKELSEQGRKKLEETEKKVQQLQESLTR